MRPLYKVLNYTRKTNPVLYSPELGAKMIRLQTNNDKVFACVRDAYVPGRKLTNTVVAFINMSNEPQDVTIDMDKYVDDYFDLDGNMVTLEDQHARFLEPWQFIILTDMD
jgi:hypothetical protein